MLLNGIILYLSKNYKMEREMKYVPSPKTVEGWHYEAKCEFCGTKFQAKRRTAKFCSSTCRVMYHYSAVKKMQHKKQTTMYASGRDELIKFFDKMGVNLRNTTISYNLDKTITIKGEKWIIKRMGHMDYVIEKE